MFRSQFASFQSRRHFSGGHFDKYKSITNYRNTTRLLGGIVTVNVVGFVLWNIDRIPSDIKDRISAETRKRMPNWLKANATNSLRNFREGRWWTLLTCSFSHRDPNHLIGNMFSLYTFGTVFAYLPRGIPIVATITLGSALSASGADLAIQAARETPGYEQASLGASGVVMGLGTAAAALRPAARVALFGLVPVPLFLLLPGYIAWAFLHLHDERSRVGHAAHLGGAAFGALFYLLRLRAK